MIDRDVMRLIIGIFFFILLSSPAAFSSEYVPHWQTNGSLVGVARGNSDALMFQGSYNKKYSYSFNESFNVEDGYIQFGTVGRVSPASVSAGGNIEWLPMAVLQFKLESELIQYFGNFSNVLTFENLTDNYSDDARADLEDDAQASTVIHHKGDAILRAKLKSVVGRYVYSKEYFDFDVDGTYIYEPGYDLLMENQSYITTKKLEFFYDASNDSSRPKLIGLFHESNEADSTNMELTKVGVQSLWSSKLASEEVLLLGQFGQHLKSRYREDEVFLTIGIIKRLSF